MLAKMTNRYTRSAYRVSIAASVMACTAAAAGAWSTGCGGDDNTVLPSYDAATDHTSDAIGADGNDATSDDTGSTEAGDAADAMAFDAGDAMAILTPSQLLSAEGQAFCSHLETCCLEDAATFDYKLCTSAFSNGGFANSLQDLQVPGVADSGAVVIDQMKAADCVNSLATFPCGTISSGTYSAIWAQCFGAVQGTQPIDAGCRASIECAPSAFCSGTGDAGVCSSLIADGGSCTTEEQCSYLGVGHPDDYCDLFSGNPSTCQPGEALGQPCVTHVQCQSGVCGDHNTCDTQFTVSDPGVDGGTCDYFTIKDAGGGG